MSSGCVKETETEIILELRQPKEAELNFSLDSGMEDPILADSHSDDSDDEIVCKRKTKRKTILDDDDDDVEEVDRDLKDSSPSPSNEDKENEPAEIVATESYDDDFKLNLEMENEDAASEEKDKKNDDETGEDDPVEFTSLRMEFKDSDLFDAESEDEQRPAHTDDEHSENNSSHEDKGENDDEGFDESQLDPKLLAKLKKLKGASKTPKEKEKLARKAKPTAEQMSELYSESQRMLRDSRVNLPYYEPETKSLDDFLARASKKRQEYSVLKKPKDFQKALIIQEKLSVTPPKQSRCQKDSRFSVKGKAVKTGTEEKSYLSECVPVLSCDSGIESQKLSLCQASTVILNDNVSSVVADSNRTDDDEELPDINPVLAQIDSTINVEEKIAQQSSLDVENAVESSKLSLLKENLQNDQVSKKEGENSEKTTEIVSLQKYPSRDLFNSLTTEEQIEEQSFQKAMKGVEDHDLCIEKDNNENVDVFSDDKTPGKDNFSSLQCDRIPSWENSELNEGLESKDETTNCEDKESFESKNDSPSSKPSKLLLLEKLEQQGLIVDLPKLSGSPDSVINLENEASSKTPKGHGVLKLMDRLIQHQTKKKANSSYDVNLSIIEKEVGEGEQKELKLKSLIYHVEEEKEELPSTVPGAKLTLLKEKLGVGMKMRREEARLRRQQMFNLENEEGFAGKSDDEEQEEAEMTDEESSSDEEEEEEEGLMDRMDGSDDEEDYNPLLDTEAREDDDDDDGYGMDEDSNDVKLRFEVSDEEEEEEDEDGSERENEGNDSDDTQELEEQDESMPAKGKKKLRHSILSDDEEESKMHKKSSIHKTDHHSDDESLPDIELTPLTKHFQDTQYPRDSSRSPELYGPGAFEESSNSTRPGDNLNDSGGYYNPHSQMLDADGYLKMTQTQRPPKSRISLLVDAPESEDNAIMDGFDSSCKLTPGRIFGGMSGQIDSQTDNNMSELLGLCSGTFQQNSMSEDAINPSQNRRYEEEGELSNPFHIVDTEDDTNTVPKRKRIKPVLSDSEDEREKDTDIEDDVDDESNHLSRPGKFTGFKDKISKGIRKEFLENEAELSGSEFDSDENLDLDEEDDILEEEAGDRDMAGVSEEELRNQVGKVHMKQLLDDDDRAVMRYKEMYLQDGDLYSDGNGRMRHFRWKDMGDSSQQDLFQHQSDEEHVEEEAEEVKWRKERIEREKFIEESQQGEDESNKEFQKFGQLFVKRSDSTSSLKSSMEPQKSSKPKQPSLKKKGSFLSRGKDALVKFAQVAKTALGGNSKQKSHSFVFQSKENQEVENEVEVMPQPMHPPKRKAHSVTGTSTTQVAKKPRLSTNVAQAPPSNKRHKSIFNLLDK